MNTGVNYKLFYEILLNLREAFHSYGRIDDSNTKLDEIIKLIMLSYYYAINGKRFSLELVRRTAASQFSDEDQVAPALRMLFEEAAEAPIYKNIDGTSIFGANATLNIQPSENVFAEKLISEIEKIDFLNLIKDSQISNFDIINECFGHFVRENFRNNKEDAQYMTPAEIAIPVLEMIFSDFQKEHYFEKVDYKSFTIMDPTCGVGTLLIEASRQYVRYISKLNLPDAKETELITQFLETGMLGQDKVDRMVRLSKINTLLMGGNSGNIFIGNSISGHTEIDELKDGVDLIFTNPPFGAEYGYDDLIQEDFELLDQLNCQTGNICSELLMLLKCLSLLKVNGKLAIVLPDSVFSAKGLNAQVRNLILSNYRVNAVIEMPAVTFAQAGTRTKTSILYLTKCVPKTDDKIIMAICNDIGYTVKERMGVPVKITSGTNEMYDIARVYTENFHDEQIISHTPSVTWGKKGDLIDEIINPSFYSADRLQTLSELETRNIEGYELKTLSEIVKCVTLGRKNKNTSDSVKHISVLHINPDCTIDFQQVLSYAPISKGRTCSKGDILFSKINPRIPRMTVVPEFDKDLVCSNEFEIFQPSADIGAYAICFLLKTSYVAKQIENLTSGTSSSHSRIKREQLMDIKIPYPVSEAAKQEMQEVDSLIKRSFAEKYIADTVLRDQLNKLENI
ncbi:N-6 DNA methylase [Enterocloster bolteae]|uniref:N-6 DNA methylase n=1 Tax=Enterocloster bolteae TaxID=208479 RepID=UPI002A840CF5|nr:N-6 DNA methylase [Enterocloster bolteae]